MTTDNQNEVFDIVDTNDCVIGHDTRGRVHADKSLIHRSVYIAVFNSKGELFMQQRSSTKDKDPLFWDISVGGHVLSGDSYKKTAERELNEELGIHTSLTYVTKYFASLPSETEIVSLFTTQSNGPFVLHPQEIQGGRFFSQEILIQQIQKKDILVSLSPLLGLKQLGWM